MTATSRSAAATTPTSRTAWAERRRGSRATAGATRLLLDLKSHDRVRADLSRSRVTATKAGVEESVRVRGFNGLIVAAKRAVVIGTDRIERSSGSPRAGRRSRE